MVETLEEKKIILMRLRQTTEQQNVDLDEIDPSNNIIDMETLGNIQNEDLDKEGNDENAKPSIFNSSFVYAICVIVILVVTWIYFSKTN